MHRRPGARRTQVIPGTRLAGQPAAGRRPRAALAAYTGMWQQMQAAGVTADWKDPRLADYASGQALRTLVTGLRNARDQGIVIKGTIVTHPRVVSVTPAASPDWVLVSDCLDDTHWLNYVAATGRLQNNVPGGHRLTQAAVTGRAGAVDGVPSWRLRGRGHAEADAGLPGGGRRRGHRDRAPARVPAGRPVRGADVRRPADGHRPGS